MPIGDDSDLTFFCFSAAAMCFLLVELSVARQYMLYPANFYHIGLG